MRGLVSQDFGDGKATVSCEVVVVGRLIVKGLRYTEVLIKLCFL